MHELRKKIAADNHLKNIYFEEQKILESRIEQISSLMLVRELPQELVQQDFAQQLIKDYLKEEEKRKLNFQALETYKEFCEFSQNLLLYLKQQNEEKDRLLEEKERLLKEVPQTRFNQIDIEIIDLQVE